MAKTTVPLQCKEFENLKELGIEISISIQTNAMLIDDDWVNIFSKYDIFVGVSIDGPETFNDMYRIDKNGNGTYQKTISGLKLLMEAHDTGLIRKPGVISVINPEFDASIIYKHLTNTLDLNNLHYLYFDDTHDTSSLVKVLDIKKYTQKLLDCWLNDSVVSNKIRFITTYVDRIKQTPFQRDVFYNYANLRSLIITIDSNGDIGPEDTLRSIIPDAFGNNLNISNAKLKDIFENKPLMQTWVDTHTIPSACNDCEWKSVCRGGELKNRYDDKKKSFDNKSIYCSVIQNTLEVVSGALLNNGMSIEAIESNIQSYNKKNN
ncbi:MULTISPECIES: radical SAM protein [unclassified Pseudoalteromonas]|uniref:radical SAM protein n=1 Tax=unclassified Pseudoalteromonas TaxID=194690 RepID=UPI0005AB5BEC|nr:MULTISPECIES: radical SAM protein [unclassified Pseudoalteromonas]